MGSDLIESMDALRAQIRLMETELEELEVSENECGYYGEEPESLSLVRSLSDAYLMLSEMEDQLIEIRR